MADVEASCTERSSRSRVASMRVNTVLPSRRLCWLHAVATGVLRGKKTFREAGWFWPSLDHSWKSGLKPAAGAATTLLQRFCSTPRANRSSQAAVIVQFERCDASHAFDGHCPILNATQRC